MANVFIVDSRETNSGIPAHLKRAGIPFEMQELSAGDYRVGDFLIERKSVADFAASIMDGRLFEQAEQLVGSGYRPLLLLEGDLSKCPSEMHPDSLTGALSALTVFWNIQLVCTPDIPGSCSLLARLHKHQSEGLGYEIATRVLKPKDQPDGAQAQYLVCGLPGVGPELARKLLGHFGSARAVFMAGETELMACKGVGPKTAKGIVQALTSRPTHFRTTKFAPQ